MVPEANFSSYYGRPVLKEPTWRAADIAGYLFLGGLAGGCSIVAAGADLTGRRRLARATRTAPPSVFRCPVALVHDLGRPSRFYAMLRVLKPTSPMSVGSWLRAVYAPLAAVAAGCDVLRVAPRAGRLLGLGAAMVAPALTSYTAVLLGDTALPA